MIKRKNILLISLISLSTVSLIAVGFSSWIINNTVGDTSDNFKITFGKVEDNSISTSITSSDLTIAFDALSKDSCTGSITNGDGNVEDLNYSVTFTLTSQVLDLSTISLSFEYNDVAKTFQSTLDKEIKYVDCSCLNNFSYEMPENNVTKGTVDSNTGVTIDVTYTESSGVKTSATVTANFAFEWGEAFGNKNPCISEVEDIITVLNNFENAYSTLEEQQINLTITPVLGSN